MRFADLSQQLNSLMNALEPLLQDRDPAWWDAPYAPGKWMRRQLAGHLIDSASNNHQRFVRAQLMPTGETFQGPTYDQEGCVRVQRFDRAPVSTIAGLLIHYNRLIAFLLTQIPGEQLRAQCQIGSFPAVSLEALAIDYLAHLEHHLRQLTGASALPYSDLVWPPREAK